MSENKELELLAPEPIVITIGEDTYDIHKFCLVKGLRVFGILTEIADKADLGSALADIQVEGFAPAIARGLPRLVAVAEPQVFELMALILIPNRRVFEIAEREENLDTEIKRVAKQLRTNEALDFEKMFEILQSGYERIGIDALKTNLTKVLEKFGAATTPTPEVSEAPETTSG